MRQASLSEIETARFVVVVVFFALYKRNTKEVARRGEKIQKSMIDILERFLYYM